MVYQIEGFSCLTCAIVLETMLRQHKGVLHADASFPKESVRIEFDPNAVKEQSLRQFIAELGFNVAGEHAK